MNTSKRILLAALGAVLAVCAITPAKASLIVAWNAKSENTTLTSATASTLDPNLAGGPVTLALGPGFTPNAYAGTTFGGFYTKDTSAGMADADAAGTYWQFTLTPAAGYQMEIDSLVVPLSHNPSQSYGLFVWQNGGNTAAHACTINLASATDSYGSSLGTASVNTNIGADASTWTINLNTPLVISTAQTFRIEFSENFGYGTVGLQPDKSEFNSTPFNNALEINGSLTSASPVPEPATWGALAGLALTGFSLTSVLRRGKRAAATA